MTRHQAQQFKDALIAAESTGLRPKSFISDLARYLLPARAASEDGYSAAFAAVGVLCLVALVLMTRLIRKPAQVAEVDLAASAESGAVQRRDASQAGGQEVPGARGETCAFRASPAKGIPDD